MFTFVIYQCIIFFNTNRHQQESEHWELFSEDERQEFLFLLFKHLILGGPICQYDDKVERYLEVFQLY